MIGAALSADVLLISPVLSELEPIRQSHPVAYACAYGALCLGFLGLVGLTIYLLHDLMKELLPSLKDWFPHPITFLREERASEYGVRRWNAILCLYVLSAFMVAMVASLVALVIVAVGDVPRAFIRITSGAALVILLVFVVVALVSPLMSRQLTTTIRFHRHE